MKNYSQRTIVKKSRFGTPASFRGRNIAKLRPLKAKRGKDAKEATPQQMVGVDQRKYL